MKLKTVTNVSLDGVTQGHRRIDVEVPGKPMRRGAGSSASHGSSPPLVRTRLELVDLQSNGLTIQTYRHAGRPQSESETT